MGTDVVRFAGIVDTLRSDHETCVELPTAWIIFD